MGNVTGHRTIADDGSTKLYVEMCTNGPVLQCDEAFLLRLTPTRVRKIIRALMPYAEWTPGVYRSERFRDSQ